LFGRHESSTFVAPIDLSFEGRLGSSIVEVFLCHLLVFPQGVNSLRVHQVRIFLEALVVDCIFLVFLLNLNGSAERLIFFLLLIHIQILFLLAILVLAFSLLSRRFLSFIIL
jgi:hypothetical protein